jgi:hypothetical protein
MLSLGGGDEVLAVDAADVLVATAQEQQVAASPSVLSAHPGQAVSFAVTYTTSTGDATLTGLGLRLHYNSSLLTFSALHSVFGTPTQNQSPANDTNNYDGDTSTDKYVFVAWADMSGAWPGSIPVTLYTANFTAVASATGTSTVRFTASSTASGYTLSSTPATITFATPSTIVGRYLFYNNSSFDGNSAAANASDDNAIATDKTPLLANQQARFANYSSYSRGINGLMVDFDNLSGTPTTADFQFRVGNSSSTSSWTTLATSPTVTVRTNVGTEAVDRVTLVWADGTISGKWLEVTVLATSRTGLTASSVFYFGNAPGETGNRASNAVVDGADYTATRSAAQAATVSATVTNVYDFNRDGSVTTSDLSIVRAKLGHLGASLKLITPTGTTSSAVVAESVGQTTAITEASATLWTTSTDTESATAIDPSLVTVPAERVDGQAAVNAPLARVTTTRVSTDETTEAGVNAEDGEETSTLRSVAAHAAADLARQSLDLQTSLFAQDAVLEDWNAAA